MHKNNFATKFIFKYILLLFFTMGLVQKRSIKFLVFEQLIYTCGFFSFKPQTARPAISKLFIPGIILLLYGYYTLKNMRENLL